MTPPTWLARFPVGLFAIPVGLFALAGSWHRAQAFEWSPAATISLGLAWTALGVLGILFAVYLAKCFKHPRVIADEFTHPLAGSLMALMPLAFMLTVVYFGEAGHPVWLYFLLFFLLLQGVVAIRIVSIITVVALPIAAVTPALYIPPVAGGFVGAMALHKLGYPGWATMSFGMALASWALLEVRILNRLFEGAMPESLRPTIGLKLAPPTVGTFTASTLWPDLPGELLVIGIGLAMAPLIAVLSRYKWWSHVPFSIGFWSFSFPLAALAGGVIEVVRRGGWPPAVAGLMLGAASSVIAFLFVRTLWLLVRGKLIPALPPHARAH
jgi:tellurite resistance protein